MRACPRRLGLAFAFTIALALGSFAWSAHADAASLFEKNFWLSGPRYHGKLPACDASSALSRISSHFAQTRWRKTCWG